MSDQASFNFEDLREKIWLPPVCILSGIWNIHFHHILGRGGKRNRKMHSSVFNSVPLCDTIHAYGAIHHPEIEAYFLRKAREKVMEAVLRNRYELNQNDKDFSAKYHI